MQIGISDSSAPLDMKDILMVLDMTESRDNAEDKAQQNSHQGLSLRVIMHSFTRAEAIESLKRSSACALSNLSAPATRTNRGFGTGTSYSSDFSRIANFFSS
ncbi:uncharacterized protein MELLADRAFT_107690 [Melampsora larici-populina 98AG31]|uniref:Uncharacterized protein n=1 Tax=Melampsora larici-populina (strain 98AG31 / pathotype 3-4-7) TaxID=747676 RepID=F4RQG2_MELLP|nr:uncharacterized protein MELLADRAFT_107690 [Melampsora larici-populina 98AG31]EGG05404.1 hypothetical protein MELLADRAFT_107690 [Melampsora larici-populina 98AG31]